MHQSMSGGYLNFYLHLCQFTTTLLNLGDLTYFLPTFREKSDYPEGYSNKCKKLVICCPDYKIKNNSTNAVGWNQKMRITLL